MTNTLTLLDLTLLVRNRLRKDFPDTFWVQAEVSECKEHYSGHCYLELVQKKDKSDALCAKTRATIWANVWSTIKPKFVKLTGSPLQAGQKILVEVQVEFHELYGFSLLIRDIDPTYTVGDVSLRRQEVIRKLTEDGVIDLNKELTWPILPKKLAIVSSPSAAGYEDFMQQLQNNPYGFKFSTHFFATLMQGEMAGIRIQEALDSILNTQEHFDVVVLIRGGGATTDLQCFDQYDLCFYAAQYPLPLLTGIGHDRDSSVLDRVAHTSVKTPTAAAEYLIDCLAKEAYRLDTNIDNLQRFVQARMDQFKQQYQSNSEKLQRKTSESLHRATINLERLNSTLQFQSIKYLQVRSQRVEVEQTKLTHQVQSLLENQKHRFELLESKLDAFSPDVMIKKGFSLTLHQGRILKSIADLQPGSVIETRLKDGQIQSIIQKTALKND